MDNKILIISEKESFITKAMAENLEDASFETRFCRPVVGELDKSEEYPIILLYLGDYVDRYGEGLTFLKDKIVEEESRLFVVGSEDEIKDVSSFIPESLITGSFIRPLNVKNLVEAIEDTRQIIRKEGEKKKILVVDDDPVMLRTIKGWLEDTYQVVMVNSGMNAITYLAKNKPDLILLDYEMPVVTGAKVLEMIRSEVSTASLPVIFLTSKSDKESVMEVLKLKPEGYLLKSMTPEEILGSLDEFFKKRKNI